MSSFLIDKEEYIKATALVAGIMTETANLFRRGECKERCNTYFYSHITEYAIRLYELNDISVSKQYEEEREGVAEFTDFDKVLFDSYKARAANMSKQEQVELANNLMGFFNSVMYQIEDKRSVYEAGYIIRVMEREMRDALNTNPTTMEWWGAIELD